MRVVWKGLWKPGKENSRHQKIDCVLPTIKSGESSLWQADLVNTVGFIFSLHKVMSLGALESPKPPLFLPSKLGLANEALGF